MLSLPNNDPAGRLTLLPSLLILAAWLVALGLVALNRQNLIDWWRLRDYQAPAAVASLASQTTLTDFGRKVFYVNHPTLTSKADFRHKCPHAGGEQTIVLGCYHGGQSGIYLLDVSDPRLEGVEQVTAAHEMLHGAYERLSSAERQRIDRLLQDFYKQLQDQRILKTIEAYKKSEPKEVVNEMHSIFGTEIAELPAELEAYYKRYFSNRRQIVAYAERYQGEFTSRQDAIIRYDSQLESLKTQIDAAKAELQTKELSINEQRATLLSQRQNGNIAAYNAGVPAYNAVVESYNQQVEQIQSLITQYNQTVAARNAIVLEEGELLQDLSTDVAPITR